MLENLQTDLFLFLSDNFIQFQLILILLILIYYLIIFPVTSPLWKIPGPYLHRISFLPSLNSQRRGTWIQKVYNLHLKYGNVVVLSPNEISCTGDFKYVNDIYVKNMPKSDFYKGFTNHGGKQNIFTCLEADQHLKFKKMIYGLYLKTSVFSKESKTRKMLTECTQKLMTSVYKSSVYGEQPDLLNVRNDLNLNGKGHRNPNWFNKSKNKNNLGIDTYTLFGSLTMDVVSRFELGYENGTNLIENPNQRNILLNFRQVSSMQFYTALLPQYWNLAASKLILKSADVICNFQINLYKMAEKNKNNTGKTTLTTLHSFGFHNEDAYSFITDQLSAGHETTAIILTYICYELSRPANEKIRLRLLQELNVYFGKASSDDDLIDDVDIIDNLPYLNAIIEENLRIHTPIPGAEPRLTDKPYLIPELNTLIPKGTIISCLPFALHRTKTVFPNHDKFIPERWLKYDYESPEEFQKRLINQRRFMMPFGKGIRMCLGMNLALIEIKLAIANLYWKFHSKLDIDWCNEIKTNDMPIKLSNKSNNTNDQEMMTMYDSYTIRPFNDECWLRWYKN
ncbi:unnamed protein product [Candida verbasci]|uniref:Cytochrome P450 n=1 Tax=Candida verbasci TaxID=1227364 RepID=A0A9W4U069_9ASCO|nr:unnamed protein product [Candida verbasci]